MATASQRSIARALVPGWSGVLDATLDEILDIAAAAIGATEYGDHYDRAVALHAAATTPSLSAEVRAEHRARLDSITRSRPAALPWVAR